MRRRRGQGLGAVTARYGVEVRVERVGGLEEPLGVLHLSPTWRRAAAFYGYRVLIAFTRRAVAILL